MGRRVEHLKETYRLVLKYRGKGKIIFYADDVIYFPWSSTEDPKDILELRGTYLEGKLGIEVNEGKSG
jgi:hypothetical protein